MRHRRRTRVYDSPLAPEFFVILVDAAAVQTTDQLFDALVIGFSQAVAVINEADARSGRDYRCVGAVRGRDGGLVHVAR
ncbi:MAG: hypothetical protein M3M93_03940 [Actinomycetota bacterium]|nr:hypothetical protein [Actinomycetota bacterium]